MSDWEIILELLERVDLKKDRIIFKIRSLSQSEKIQEYLLSKGIKWYDNGTEIIAEMQTFITVMDGSMQAKYSDEYTDIHTHDMYIDDLDSAERTIDMMNIYKKKRDKFKELITLIKCGLKYAMTKSCMNRTEVEGYQNDIKKLYIINNNTLKVAVKTIPTYPF